MYEIVADFEQEDGAECLFLNNLKIITNEEEILSNNCTFKG